MAQEANRLTRQHFGRTIRMFGPVYLSNECINNCKYCGFSRDNPILRVTLTVDQVETEARYLADQGFRSILLVAGEHPKFVSQNYLVDCVERIKSFTPSIGLEVGPMEVEGYEPIVRAGAEYLIVFQEDLQPGNLRRSSRFRAKERLRVAHGLSRTRLSGGLSPSRHRRPVRSRPVARGEALALAMHAEYLLKHCWKAFLHVTLPRLRPAAGGFQPRFEFNDRDMTQLVCALRICFPQIGITQSTRERAEFRDALMQLGVTTISAASRTEPGGYTGAGPRSTSPHEKRHSRGPPSRTSLPT